jgi:hypothetical protein
MPSDGRQSGHRGPRLCTRSVHGPYGPYKFGSGTQAEWQGTLVYAIPRRSCTARGGEVYDCRWKRWRHALPGWWARCHGATVVPKRGYKGITRWRSCVRSHERWAASAPKRQEGHLGTLGCPSSTSVPRSVRAVRPNHATPRRAKPCLAPPRNALPSRARPCHAEPCHVRGRGPSPTIVRPAGCPVTPLSDTA